MIQDRTSRMLISAGEQHGGVYWLRTVTPAKMVCHVNGTDTYQLWHRRLGHAPKQLISSLPTVHDNNFQDVPCDICFRAKQTCEFFPLSTNKVVRLFDLIHCDILGPYSEPSSCGAFYFLTIVDDFSRVVWVYLMIEKSEVKRILKISVP